MRASIALVLLAACGGAPKPAPAAAPVAEIMTGDPVPAGASEPATCASGYRWLGAEPHVPLAISSEAGITEAGGACCAAWGQEAVWTEVDAWGAPVADRTIVGGEGYDVTQCYELVTDVEAALLVRGEVPWQAPPSARWEPTDAERASLHDFAASVDRVFAAPLADDERRDPATPLADRVVFFELPGDPGDDRVMTRFAAIGGRALVIAGLDGHGTWRTQYLDASWGLSAGPWLDDAYRVLAVFDMDGDGFAEVIVHRADGPSWDDAVLTCEHDSTLRPWSVLAESIGGSTA